MARFFIERPVFAIVLSLFITIGGIIAGFNLPIAQYPQISPPQVSVSATYTGANAKVVEETVAQVIEKEVNGVEDMVYMSSTSSDSGRYSLNVRFKHGVDPDMATVRVQNKVAQANATLPQDVLNNGVTTKKVSPDMALMFALSSPKGTYDATFLKNYGSVYFIEDVKRVKGVGDIAEYGSDFAMRIWLKPDKMAQLGVTAADISTAIESQNIQAPAGGIGKSPVPTGQEFEYTVQVQGRLIQQEEFENIIVRSLSDGSSIKVKDIATVELESRTFSFHADMNRAESAGFAVNLTPDANALDTVAGVRQVLDEAAKNLPDDVKLLYIYDSTENIRASLTEVVHTFFEALLLVLVVVFLFLQSARATFIPMLAIPVSLVGTFAAFVALDFSINTLTLFAMVLAIGLVVDDAIVVIEAVEYNMRDKGLSPKEATIAAMDQVSGPVIAIAFVLASVFIPVAFMGGTTGILYRQFALTIAISMALSAIVALSLTPALCTLMLKPHDPNAHKGLTGRFFDAFNNWFERTVQSYGLGLGKVTKRVRLVMVLLVVLVIMIGGIAKYLPTAFVPEEDQGFFAGSITLPEATNLERTRAVALKINDVMVDHPSIKMTGVISGFDIITGSQKPNAATMFVPLVDWKERTASVQDLIGRAFGITMPRPEATSIFFNMPALPGLGSVGGFEFVVQDRSGGSVEELAEVSNNLIDAARKRPEFMRISSNLQANTPGYRFDVDREKVQKLGVPLSDVFVTLQAFLGGYPVNDFTRFGKTYKVMLQAEAPFRADVDDIRFLFVRNNNGEMIPVDTLIKPVQINGPINLNRFNAYRSFTISGSQSTAYSSGQAMAAMEEVAGEVLPQGYTFEWTGQSLEEKESGSTTALIFALAICFAFLCLAALYESWSVPFVVLLSVPSGLLGCFFFQYIRGLENDIYMQIALITTIGLAAKNAILIVEYAKVRTDAGMDIIKAVIEASKIRLRPIIMTSLCFIFGCLPLALAAGAGAAARNSMGTAVVGGMFTATILGVFLVPVLFIGIQRITNRLFKPADASKKTVS